MGTPSELGVAMPCAELWVHILVCGCGVRILWFTACYTFCVSIVCVCVCVCVCCVCVCVCVCVCEACYVHIPLHKDCMGWHNVYGERAHSRLSSSCALSPSSLISCCTHAHTWIKVVLGYGVLGTLVWGRRT